MSKNSMKILKEQMALIDPQQLADFKARMEQDMQKHDEEVAAREAAAKRKVELQELIAKAVAQRQVGKPASWL
jgi:guanylate kinase